MTSTRDILERNDLVYKTLPPRWVFGLPIGNGQVGGMIWVEDESKVVITLDSVLGVGSPPNAQGYHLRPFSGTHGGGKIRGNRCTP